MTVRFLSLPLLALTTVLLGSGCGWLVSEPSPEIGAVSPQPTATPERTLEDITLTEAAEDGRLLWQLTARLARYNQEETAASLESVTGEVFDQDNRAIRVKANGGAAYPNENRLELVGDVQIQSLAHHLQITADRVAWWPDDNRLQAEGNVTVAQLPDELPEDLESSSDSPAPVTLNLVPATVTLWVAQGDQLKVNLNENLVTLENQQAETPVQGRVRQPDVQLQATAMTWNIETSLLTATGPIQVDYPEQQLQLQGEVLTTTIPSEQVRLSGNTYSRSEETGQELWADQLDWTPNTPIVQASGNVSYRQPGQRLALTGESATVDWQNQSVAVAGGTTTELTLP